MAKIVVDAARWPLVVVRYPAAFGLPEKYQTGAPPDAQSNARAWLTFARRMGEHRALTSHPLNPKLFSAEMLAGMPR